MQLHQWPAGPMQNFVYLLDDEQGAAALVDPAFDMPSVFARIEALPRAPRVTHILATHGHSDHVAGVAYAKERTGAVVVAQESADHPFDHAVKHGDVLRIGRMSVEVLHTPGHRFDAVCYVVDRTHILTGDTLFVGECGRVDLPGSDVDAMHRSLVTTLRALPDELVVCPGHDYGKTPLSTIGEEKRTNYTMRPRTLEEFRRFMAAP